MRSWSEQKREAYRQMLEGMVGIEMIIEPFCEDAYVGKIEEFLGETRVKVTLIKRMKDNARPELSTRWMEYTSAIYRHPAISAFYKLYE